MKLKEKLIEFLLADADLDETNRGYARAFLSHVFDQCSPDVADVAAVMASRLVMMPNWRTWLNVPALREFCTERRDVIQMLRQLPATVACDPEAEYLHAITAQLAIRLQNEANK
jgi:hypothetical protein